MFLDVDDRYFEFSFSEDIAGFLANSSLNDLNLFKGRPQCIFCCIYGLDFGNHADRVLPAISTALRNCSSRIPRPFGR